MSIGTACLPPRTQAPVQVAAPSAPSACWNPGGVRASFVEQVRDLVTSPGEDQSSVPDSLRLPRVHATAVRLDTTEATCARAVRALNDSYRGPDEGRIRAVIVVAVGDSHFVVWDGRSRAGEFDICFVYDQSFRSVFGYTC